MPQAKKRPSKSAKAAQKKLNDSQLLTDSKAAQDTTAGSEFRPVGIMPKTTAANKVRPEKKRG